jgi:hypothetical protein
VAIADAAVPAHIKARIRHKEFEGRMRRGRYESSALELFAEAIACAICDPERFDAGAPGLREALRRVAGPEGFPV